MPESRLLYFQSSCLANVPGKSSEDGSSVSFYKHLSSYTQLISQPAKSWFCVCFFQVKFAAISQNARRSEVLRKSFIPAGQERGLGWKGREQEGKHLLPWWQEQTAGQGKGTR